MSTNGRIFVLSGGPSTGKTTVIERLSAAGYPVVREAAADVLRRPAAAQTRREAPQVRAVPTRDAREPTTPPPPVGVRVRKTQVTRKVTETDFHCPT